MRGHIRKRGKDSWTVVISLGHDPSSGKRLQKWVSIKGTKRDAEKALAEFIHSIEEGSYIKPHRLTVGEWLNQWLESYAGLHSSPRTAENYGSVIRRHLIPSLGALLLFQLRPQHLQSYYARALSQGRADGQGGLSAASVLRHHKVISQALGFAVKQGLLARNVAQACDPPHPARPSMSTLAEGDVPRFLVTAQGTPYYVLFYTALYTGMRRGELLGLRWGDLDLDMATLSVVQTLQRVGGAYIIKEPKSQRSRRQVSLPPSLALLLRKYRTEQSALHVLLGKPLSDGDLVFAHPDGMPFEPSVISHQFAWVLRKAGLPHIRLHDLRHTHASLMLKAGVHPKIVSERLGHASVAITLDTYSHTVPGLQEAAAQRFDRMLEPQREHLSGEGEVSKRLADAPGTDMEVATPEAVTTSLKGRGQGEGECS
ncbi:MAG: site-specific integrase [Dehalococcoidia bacterium]|nr:site-specific integrase [Dehalococcoidia bacterium]